MILQHSQYTNWYRATNLDDLSILRKKIYGKGMTLTNEEAHVVAISTREGGVEGREFTHYIPTSASAVKMKADIALFGTLKGVEMATQTKDSVESNQINGLVQNGVVNINNVGGYNNCADFMDDEDGEWIETTLGKVENSTISTFKAKIERVKDDKSKNQPFKNIFLENDPETDAGLYTVASQSGINSYDWFSIVSLQSVIDIPEFSEFIEYCIKENGTINLGFSTVSRLSERELSALAKFAKYVDTLYVRAGDREITQLREIEPKINIQVIT